MYPNNIVQRNVNYLFERIRRKTTGIRDRWSFNIQKQPDSYLTIKSMGLLPERAALWKTVLLAKEANQISPGWDLGIRTIVDGLCRLGCYNAALDFLESQDNKLRLNMELSVYKNTKETIDNFLKKMDS